MQTTERWWKEVSSDSKKMIKWLKKQYHGELTAEHRIRSLITLYNLEDKSAKLISTIADDEAVHAELIEGLLLDRDVEPESLVHQERYRDIVLPVKDASFEYMCAVGYYAETMRLDRIRLLATEPKFKDIANTFYRILPDEIFHSKVFKFLSDDASLVEVGNNHRMSVNALGLVI